MRLKRIITYSILGVLSIASIILGCFIRNTTFLSFFELPYQGMAALVKISAIDKASVINSILSWALFIVLGFIPEIYPLVQLIRRKPYKILYACWVVVLAFSYLTLYVDINPQTMQYVIPATDSFIQFSQVGMALTTYLAAILLLVIEALLEVKRDKINAIFISKVLLIIIAVCIIVNVFYAELSKTITSCQSVSKNEEYVGINIFHIIFCYLMTIASNFAIFVVLYYLNKLLDGVGNSMFDRKNEKLTHKLFKSLAILITLTIGLSIVKNLITFVLQKYLYNMYYSAIFDLGLVLVAMLGALFIVFMTKSIEIKEENDLTI